MNKRKSNRTGRSGERIRYGKSPEYISTLRSTWKLIIVITLLLGIVLFAGGVAVAVLGNQANTKMTFLGQEFTSTSVGVALAFVGAVMVVFVIRRLLKSIDHATSGDIEP